MTKVKQTIELDTEKIIKRILDFIIFASGLSAIIMYYLISAGKISNTYVIWVFMPGYILMMIFMIFLRLVAGMKDPKEDKNDNGD